MPPLNKKQKKLKELRAELRKLNNEREEEEYNLECSENMLDVIHDKITEVKQKIKSLKK